VTLTDTHCVEVSGVAKKLTHLDDAGRADMVDVGDKPQTDRMAVAEGWVMVQAETLALIQAGNMKKGDVLTVARIAGIMGAKQTSNLIPLCHPVPITKIGVDLRLDEGKQGIYIRAQARTLGQTGIEMEVLTAVSITALTIYDMAKAVDREMRIEGIRLLEKRGGVHGDYIADA
jgi:cyclic pyranopterin phosphate synthase